MACTSKYSKEPYPNPYDLEALILHYKRSQIGCCGDNLEWYEESADLAEAISRAASAKTRNGKRHSHQRLIPYSALSETPNLLSNAKDDIGKCASFNELHEILKSIVVKVNGVGELYAYDTADRIGAFLKLRPTKVYLHRGTRDGAIALGLGVRKGYIEMKDLPSPLNKMQPEQVEDFLCLYKSKLKPTSPI